jgi:hypothetical protein
MCPATLISILIIVVVFPVAVFLMITHFFGVRSFRNKFIETYGGKAAWSNNNWVTDIDGCQVSFVYTPTQKNDPSKLVISLKGGFFAHAAFRTETSTDRLAKDLGFNQEIQLFDPAFDNAVYVECEDRDFINYLLSGPEVKNYLQGVLRDMTSFHIDGNRCFMVKTPCDDLALLNADELMGVASSMVGFSKKIPLPGPGAMSATPLTDECRRWTRFFVGFSGVLSGAGVALILWGLAAFRPLMPGKLFWASLYVSIPLASVLVLYMFYQFKGLSVALRFFKLAAIFSITGAVLVSWGGGMVLNGSQDVSEKVPHQVTVMDKYTTHSKGETTYHIRTNSWDSRFPYYRFSAGKELYQRINAEDPCIVTTGSGLFGFEWVASHVCHPAGS